MKEQFTEHRFYRKSMELIDQAMVILDQYAALGYTLTVRQTYYQLVVRNVILNSKVG